jgi:hypothetical protein
MSYEPQAVGDISPAVLDELRRIANAFRQFSAPLLTAAPTRPSNGAIVYADGTEWDPGSGEGFYGYEDGAWVKL